MHNLIPSFVQEKYRDEQFSGSLKAATMFIDISGFTAMTQTLMKCGKEGAEVLNNILNNIFEPVIDAVYDRNGFISTFAGDAFTAVFPDHERPLDCCHAAMAIRQTFQEKGQQVTKFGVFGLTVKIGLSHGNVKWGIVGSEDHKTWFFRGMAINSCSRAEKRCDSMQIVMAKPIYELVNEDVTVELKAKTYMLLTDISKSEEAVKSISVPTVTKEIALKFLPVPILEYGQKGEFRDVVSVFVSFKEPSTFRKLDKFVRNVLQKVDNFGGFFEILDFGDKGGNCLIIFGAPVSYENNIQRAVNFVYSVRGEFTTDIRAGVTFGTVFAGIKGSKRRSVYGVLGDVVNLSARFMMEAGWGEIYLDQQIIMQVEAGYEIAVLKPCKFKGFAGDIPVYRLIERKQRVGVSFFEGEMVGRDSELNRSTELLQPVTDGRFGGLVYVYGNAGIGKSRLIYELVQKQGIRTFTMQTDSILKKGLNPFAYFFNHYFEQDKTRSLNDRKDIFTTIYEEFMERVESILAGDDRLESVKENLRRIESIIGAVIGLEWEGSIYSIIDPKDRPVVTQFAIKDFITTYSLLEPVILHIEDIQWLDDESQNVFEILTRQIEEYPLVILACSRFNDDGSKPELKADDDVPRHEVILDELPADSTKALIHDRLGYRTDDELTAYIQSRTEGNPFYTEQFCLYLRENDFIELIDEQYHLTGVPTDIPSNINMILITRIDRLSIELKEIVQIASVLGREFEVQMLVSLIDLLHTLEPDKSGALRERELHPLISQVKEERIWTALSEIRYIFSHALLRDAAYEMQLKARLRDLHKLAGDTIVKVYSDDKMFYADAAYHYEQAEDWENAREYCTKAGKFFTESVKYDDASIYFQKALYICEMIYEPGHPEVAACLNNLALLYREQGLYDRAEPLNLRALEIREKVFGEQHPLVATSLNNLAELYREQGLYDKAEPLYERALELLEHAVGSKHPDVATSLNNLALLYNHQGLHGKAEPLFKRALVIREKILGKHHPDIIASLNNLAMHYHYQGLYKKAEPLYLRAIEIGETVLGQQHPTIATSLNNLAELYRVHGLYDKAEPLYERALVIREQILGPQHPDVATSLNNLALLFVNQGFNDKAEPLFERALEIWEQVLGPQHPAVATILGNLAVLYENQGLYDKPEPLYLRALKIFEQVLGLQHPEVARNLNNLALLYSDHGYYNKAEPLHLRALEIHEKVLGPQHPDVVYSLNGLAKLYQAQGFYDKAEPLFKRAIKIWEKALPGHPNLAGVIENYAKLLEETGRDEEAKVQRDRAQAIRDKNVQADT